MLDVDCLEYSFQEQSNIQIDDLRKKIEGETNDDPIDDHRLFKQNPFEHLCTNEQVQLEQHLRISLEALENHIRINERIMVIDKRDMSNYKYGKLGVIELKSRNDVKLSCCAQRKRDLMSHVISKVLDLIKEDRFMTNRELYYGLVTMCEAKSNKLNLVLDDLCCLLGCNRVHLRILCQSKGIVYGNLKFKLRNGEEFDCLSSIEGIRIPTPQCPIMSILSDARFVLIIEKDSVLQKILSQEGQTHFVEKYQVILFTARGYPDINSRAFINIIYKYLKIPIFVLSDADPHGLEIACCYKFGCYSTASESSYLALPQIRWLGLLPTDVDKHSIPREFMMNLTPNDEKKLKSLMKRPYLKIRPDWLGQLNVMRRMGTKAELECIDRLGDCYLTRTFIPNKLRFASWL